MNENTPHPDEGGGSAAGASGRPDGSSFPAPVPSSPSPLADSASAPGGGGSAPEPPPIYPPGAPGTPPPPYYSYGATPPQGGAQPQNFFDWIRSQGLSRGRERWIGGVASGIAQRLGVDPLIVRGVLIVLTIFAGVGVLLYGLAWALLPEPDGRIHVQEAAAGRWSTGMTGALITTIIGFPSLGNGVWGWDRYGFGAFVWTAVWVGAAAYFVYYLTQRNKARHGNPSVPSSGPPGGPAAPANPANAGDAGTFPGTSGAPPTGPDWGPPPPSGPIPPAGGYRPVPGGTPVPPAKRRAPGPGTPAVAVTVGAALLVGGGLKALNAATVVDLGTSGNALVWASGAAILGLGILVAGLRGRTSGILGFFAVVALIIGGIFNVVPNGDRFRFQNADWTPASIEQARSGFDITGGTGTVDLKKLALDPPLGTDVVVPIDATASNLTVVIPDTVPVQVQADMTMGNLQEGNQNHGGMMNQQSDYNTGKPGARLILKISGTASNVSIKGGN